MRHPLPEGARVHHRAQEWNRHFNEAQRQENPQWGWATVLRHIPQPDRTYEYEVRVDAPHFEGGRIISWWASYHIDEAQCTRAEPRAA